MRRAGKNSGLAEYVKRCCVAVAILFLCWNSAAQDIHFSQYYFSPLSINPANTGNFSSDFRAFANYRSQWREINNAYSTFSAGGDMNFFPRGHNLAGGLLVVRDHSAISLLVTKILPSVAAHKNVAGFSVHVGVQPGIVIKTIDFFSHTFPEQMNWTTGQFDNTLLNRETDLRQQFSYFDLNAGLAVSRVIGRFEASAGVAWFHLNTPAESFFGQENILPVRMSYNGAVTCSLNPVVLHVHSVYGYTDLVSDWVSGINLEYVLSRNFFFANSVFAGFMWRDGLSRNPDAGIATAGIHFGSYTLGFSYDVTMSGLRSTVNNKGAYEIAFIYRSRSSRLPKTIVPCDRF